MSKKRDSRQYIVINEEKLIYEVQKRPILYDKTLQGYRKPTIRDHAWQEVAKNVDSTVEESKKRWRSLRDAFTKQYKQCAPDDYQTPSKKKKWLFFDQMDFLRQYLELQPGHAISYKSEYDCEYKTIEKEEYEVCKQYSKLDDDNMDDIVEADHLHEEVIDMYEDSQIEDIFTTSIETDQDGKIVDGSDELTRTDQHQTEEHQHNQTTLIQHHLQQNNDDNNCKNHNVDVLDSDERFLLSSAPVLKRLSHKKNALARIRIQQILYDIEFGDSN